MAASRGMSVFVHNGTEYNINDPNVAHEFDSSTSYATGDYVFHAGKLYRFTEPHPAGEWNANHVDRVYMGNDISKRVLFGTNTTITDSNKAAICNGTFDDLPNNKIYAVAGGTLTNSPFSSGYVQIITLGKSESRSTGDLQIAIHAAENYVASRSYHATNGWTAWGFPGMRNISYAYSDTPISVVHELSGTTVTIPSSLRITSTNAIINPPAATLTIPAGSSNWITYNNTTGQWFAGYQVNGDETYTIGWVSNGTKQAFLACMYTNTDTGATNLQSIAYAFTSSQISVVHESDQTTITIPSGTVITTQGSAMPVSGATLTTTGNSWITYDVDAQEWVLAYTVAGHRTYTIGWVSHQMKSSFIAGRYNGRNIREWGFLYSKTKLPEIRYSTSGNTLTIYDSNIVYSGGIINVSAQTLTFNSPKWLSYDIDAEEFVLSSIVEGHSVIMLGVLDATRIDNSYIAGTKLSIPKTIAFMGDSITAGSGTSKCFHEYVQQRYGFTCLNYGYGGCGWVRSNPNIAGLVGLGNPGKGVLMTAENQILPNNIVARLAELDPTAIDGVVVAAGTNDWGHSNEITLSQFRDGVDSTIEYYFEHFGTIPLLVMIPIHRINDTTPVSPGTWTLMDFANALIEECRKYGVPYIDTMSMSGCQPNNTYNAASFFARDDTHESDGIHPNHYAHERMMRAIGETLNQLVKYDDTCMR